MSGEVRDLPLFPLNLVLFPGASLPLRVFEERYKLMMQACLDGDSRFGVVLIKAGLEVGGPAEPHTVGTVAVIDHVEHLGNGEMLVSAVGERRFRITRIDRSRPYVEASVQMLEDDQRARLSELMAERLRDAVARHLRLLVGIRGGWVRDPRISGDPLILSYFIPSVLQGDMLVRQRLLEESSTEKRLEDELELLEEEAKELRTRVVREFGRRLSGLT